MVEKIRLIFPLPQILSIQNVNKHWYFRFTTFFTTSVRYDVSLIERIAAATSVVRQNLRLRYDYDTTMLVNSHPGSSYTTPLSCHTVRTVCSTDSVTQRHLLVSAADSLSVITSQAQLTNCCAVLSLFVTCCSAACFIVYVSTRRQPVHSLLNCEMRFLIAKRLPVAKIIS